MGLVGLYYFNIPIFVSSELLHEAVSQPTGEWPDLMLVIVDGDESGVYLTILRIE